MWIRYLYFSYQTSVYNIIITASLLVLLLPTRLVKIIQQTNEGPTSQRGSLFHRSALAESLYFRIYTFIRIASIILRTSSKYSHYYGHSNSVFEISLRRFSKSNQSNQISEIGFPEVNMLVNNNENGKVQTPGASLS